jgi:hypothetical protein
LEQASSKQGPQLLGGMIGVGVGVGDGTGGGGGTVQVSPGTPTQTPPEQMVLQVPFHPH